MKHLMSTKAKTRVTSLALSMALLLMTLCMGLSAKATPVGTGFPSNGSDAGNGDVYFIGYTVNSEDGDFVVSGDDVSGEKMFDGDPSTKGCIGFTGFYSVEFSYSRYIIPHSYYLRTAGDTNVFDARNPSAWKLEGKNPDNTWTVLDNKSGQAITTDNITSEKFDISNKEAYKTFKLTVTANNAGGYDPWPAGGKPTFQLSEVYMSGVKGPDPIPYMDWNGTELVEKTGDDACIKYGVIDSGSTELNAGWYVLNSDVVITKNITIYGDIKLILCDGKTLTVNNDGNLDGFNFRNGGALTIYGQSGGTGKLDVTSTYEAGIRVNGLTVNGGTVTVKSDKTDGIWSENGLTVNGGAVTATGIFNGISVNGNATVNGGTVNASGTENGISVGGDGSPCLYVNGGEVTAAGGEKAIFGYVESALPGIGWADTAGTAGREGILKSKITREFDYKKIRLALHDHVFNFAAAGATVTATCLKDDCAEGYDGASAPTLTLNAPALTVYGGTDNRKATLTSNLPKNYTAFKILTGTDFSEDDIKYVGREGTAYAESATAPTDAGKYTAKITVGGVTASVDYEIAKANPTYNVPTGLTATYGDTLSGVALTAGWAWVNGSQSVGTAGANTFKATFTPTDTANYNTVSDVDVKVTVGKANIEPTVTLEGWTYGEEANKPVVTGNSGGGEVTYTYAPSGVKGLFSDKVPTDAGDYIVKATIGETANYNGGEATAEFTVAKADSAPATVTANEITCDGTEKALVTVGGEAKGGEMQYALGTDATAAPEDGWSKDIPTGTNSDTYYVWYKVTADDNHNDSTPACAEVKISPDYTVKDVTGLSGTGKNEWQKGSEDGVVITVRDAGADNSFDRFVGVKLDGGNLAKDVDFTVKKGSTVVTLLPATLEKLSVGEHAVTVLFDNGEVGMALTVTAAKSGNATSPQTGDNSHVGLWIALMILSLCSLAATLFIGKKRVFNK